MNKLVKYVRYGCFGLALLLTSCFRDGIEECPPEPPGEYYSYIQFVYDYNMSFEDLFHRQVSKMDLYLFDENGIYMHTLTDERSDGTTFPKGYTMGLPETWKDVTQFVAFPGIHTDQMRATNMTPGQSSINDLYVSLNETESKVYNKPLKPLWHGSIVQARTKVSRNDTTQIYLKKNTNKFRIVLQSLSDSIDVDAEDFTFNLRTANNKYDAYNTPTDPTVWSYQPFEKYNDTEGAGAVAELHTLRLMANQTNRFTIRNTFTQTTVLDIDLNKYLNALKLAEYTSMSLQEYMDREDEYKIVVFLTRGPVNPDPNPGPDPPDPPEPPDPPGPPDPPDPPGPPGPEPGPVEGWISSYITINEWVSRSQPGEI